MAITRNELMDKFIGPLNKEELVTLNLIEEHYDGILSKAFNGINHISIFDSEYEKFLKEFTPLRRREIISELIDRYTKSGWSVSKGDDRSSGSYLVFK